MNGMIKKVWIGLMLGMGLLAGVNGYAADLAIEAPTGTVGGKALVFPTVQQVGTESAAQTVTLTASGIVNFEVLGIANPNFSMTDNCAAQLANSATCILTVKFTPETSGKRYAELIIRSDAISSPQTVYLQGTASKIGQTITFGTAPTLIVNGSGNVTATASSGLPVVLTSTTSGVCTIDGNTVTAGAAAGNCIIAANQSGNGSYSEAPQVTQTIAVSSKASQTITNLTVPTISVGGTGTITATGGGSDNPVTFASGTLSICTVSGSTVTGVAAGTCSITANQAGNATYNAATPVTADGLVNSKAAQTITGLTVPTVSVGGTGTITATGGGSGNPITFDSQTKSICTVSGNTVTGVAVGTCTIFADQAGNATYNAAPTVAGAGTVTAAVAGGELCPQYGITSNTLLTRAGNTSKTMSIMATQGYSFSFTTGAAGTGGQLRTNYSTVPTQYVTVSKRQCDYAASLEPLCAKQAATPLIYYKVGGTSSYQCILEPNTTYYFNVRDASRDATTKAFTNTCSGNCTFMTF